MIEILPTASPDQLEFRLTGQVSQAEYDATLPPAIRDALTTCEHIRVLVILPGSFTGFDMGAAWSDTRLGLAHWRGFDRVAVATDTRWIAIATRAAAPLMPCPVQVFSLAHTDTARRWLRESLGSVHATPLPPNALQLSLLGRLDPPALSRAGEALDTHLRSHAALRLLLDLREFDGWQGLSALAAHLHLAAGHIGAARRIAMVGDAAWQHLALRIGRRLIAAETRWFDAAAYDRARAWITEESFDPAENLPV